MDLSNNKSDKLKSILTPKKNIIKCSHFTIRQPTTKLSFDKGTSIEVKINFKPYKNLQCITDESLIKTLLARDDYVECVIDCGFIYSCRCKMLIHDNIFALNLKKIVRNIKIVEI